MSVRSQCISSSLLQSSALPFKRSCHGSYRAIHTSRWLRAAILPLTATGPPPAAPVPAASQHGERIERRRRQAAILWEAQGSRDTSRNAKISLKKRFWKDVTVDEAPDGTYGVHLSGRPLKHPLLKAPLPIPASKYHVALAIALEWDLLATAQDALRSHLIPITSLAARAHSIATEDRSGATTIRHEIVSSLVRYLDTDTLLSWSPLQTSDVSESSTLRTRQVPSSAARTLRELQIATATPILEYLSTYLWPGVELRPTFSSPESIMPTPQPANTVAVIKGWVTGLPAWNLAGLERAVLAGKSLCIASRLIAEWGEDSVIGLSQGAGISDTDRFGVEQAAEASSLEVRWQTGQWGEVEDSHDVEKEDLRRQFGMAVLCVS